MYSARVRERAAAMRAAGATWSAIARELGVNRATLRDWSQDRTTRTNDCAVCGDGALDPSAYAALLGYYLGDGCISLSANRRFYALRVSCDATYPGIIEDVSDLITQVRPGRRVFYVRKQGCVDVQANWQHWPCLFPQHGPGRKHERPIVLEDWQRRIVERHPGPFLRGFFHSDGCRITNWTRKTVGGQTKRYEYPRWQFCNASADIRELCCWALDLAGVAWRQSTVRVISVSRREAVARLDSLIGPKT